MSYNILKPYPNPKHAVSIVVEVVTVKREAQRIVRQNPGYSFRKVSK